MGPFIGMVASQQPLNLIKENFLEFKIIGNFQMKSDKFLNYKNELSFNKCLKSTSIVKGNVFEAFFKIEMLQKFLSSKCPKRHRMEARFGFRF